MEKNLIIIQENDFKRIRVKLVADVLYFYLGSSSSNEAIVDTPDIKFNLYIQIDNILVNLNNITDFNFNYIDYDDITDIIIKELKKEKQNV